jgi:hypothetical protein
MLVVTVGVTRVGEVPKTKAPLPVSPVTAEAKLAEEGVARKVATPDPSPEIPVETGKPVALVNVTELGVPKSGVIRVGELAKTKAPLPVSPVTADARLAEEGVARKVATPDPRPDIPVETGRFVALARLRELGVPKAPPTVATVPEAGRVRLDPAASPTRITVPVVTVKSLDSVSLEVTPLTRTSRVPEEVPTEVKVS